MRYVIRPRRPGLIEAGKARAAVGETRCSALERVEVFGEPVALAEQHVNSKVLDDIN